MVLVPCLACKASKGFLANFLDDHDGLSSSIMYMELMLYDV